MSTSSTRTPSIVSTRVDDEKIDQGDPVTELSKYPPELFDKLVNPSQATTSNIFTLPELIVYLTSPDKVDYSLLADFFLSYRNFATSMDIFDLLFARLTWSVRKYQQVGEQGRDVTVRTFVVLRHWILNFFGDDFVPNVQLRTRFTEAINNFDQWSICHSDITIRRVINQLKRCWSREIAIYWNIPEMKSDHEALVPGGQLSQQQQNSKQQYRSSDLESRRSCVLQYYNGPIDPVLTKPPVDTKAAGTLIRGGICLSNNVEVRSASEPVVAAKKKLKPKKSFKNLVLGSGNSNSNGNGGGGLFGVVSNALKRNQRKPLQELPPDNSMKDNEQLIRIDILSARVVEELDRILKRQSLIKKSYEQWDHRNSESTSSRHSMASTLTHESAFSFSQFSVKTASFHNDQPITIPKRQQPQNNNRLSMIDNLDISKQLESRFSQNFDRVSNFSGTLSTVSTVSYMSYDSRLSDGMAPVQQHQNEDAPIRKRNNYTNLRSAARGMSYDSVSSRASTSTTTLSSTGTFQHNPHVMVPFSGVDEEFAAKLAALPDDTPDEDAIGAALERLQGTYQKKHQSSMLDTQLYDAAFEDSSNLEDLSIPAGNLSSPAAAEQEHHDQEQVLDEDQDQDQNQDQKSVHVQDTVTVADVTNDAAPRTHQHQRTISRVPDPEEPLSVQKSISQGNHSPFILDYSAELLAEQFTLIERDALAQIDWKELIELKWNGHLEPVQSWLAFLVERNVRGVEVVISRFNLVVNWVKSEILLTWSQHERVRAISKLIHAANECRKLQNFSTVMQIILALSSPVIQKLANTWMNVSASDLKLYRKLETMVLPTHNFKELRDELNKIDGSKGCVPFVGIYLSDLTINSEAFTCDEKGKINFGKFQTASSIVKSLIQCIQWSTNYQLDVEKNQDLLSKCLYVHSLTQEEMEQCFEYLNDP